MKYKEVEQIYNNIFSETELIDFRRDIHMHPEIGGEEFRTMEKICAHLDTYGLTYEKGIADTGVVVRIKGNRPGKTIGIRADIDALPIDDATDLPYKSCVPGRMHACGHDMHTTIVLGIAKVLASLKGEFAGNFTLLFQPAEESFGGADRMIQAGALENPHVDHVVGLHVATGYKPGYCGIKYGGMYAGSDGFRIVVKGKSAHAAGPQASIDPIVTAAEIIMAIQTIVSRNTAPQDSAVVSFGAIHGGVVQNQIPDSVELKGTCRTLNPTVREFTIKRVKEISESVAAAMGATVEFTRIPSYPPLVNGDEVVDVVKNVLTEALGEDHVNLEKESEMGCEDFAYYAAARPSCFWHLGSRPDKPDEEIYGAHNTKYEANEAALAYGVKLQATIALTLAGN